MFKRIALQLSFGAQDAKYKLILVFAPWILLIGYFVCLPVKRRLAYKLLLACHRINYNSVAETMIRKDLHKIVDLFAHSPQQPGDKAISHILGRSIVLKMPTQGPAEDKEKGILLIKFTETFAYFLNHVDCDRLTENYHVILEPSWVGQALEEVLGWTRFRQPVYIQTAEQGDYRFIKNLNSNLVPIRVGSGEFVDYRVFKPLGKDKYFDCVSIGNYSDYKRIHAYVLAVKQLTRVRTDVKAAMICAGWGRRREQVYELIRLLDLEKTLHVFENLSQPEVNEIVDRSYVSVLMSYREGASKVLFESFFVNVPSIVLEENLGVNKELFQPQTGLVVPERKLPEAIAKVRESYTNFSPREWALQHIAPEKTMGKMIRCICATERNGRAFSAELYVKVNVPEARYMHDYQTIDRSRSKQMIGRYISSGEATAPLPLELEEASLEEVTADGQA